MAFRTVGQVNLNGKLIAPGKSISFSNDEADIRDELLELGEIVEVKATKADADEGAPKELGKMNLAELTAVATEEGVAVPEGVTKAKLVEAIEAKREETAK